MKHNLIPMRYPAATPMAFSGAKAFVEQHGNRVWEDLCDSMPTGEVLHINETAAELKSIKHYAQPDRYLRAVLSAIRTDYEERQDAYEHNPPFAIVGNTMKRIIL